MLEGGWGGGSGQGQMLKPEPTDLLNYAAIATMPVSATAVLDLHAIVCVCVCMLICVHSRFKNIYCETVILFSCKL